MAQGLYEIPLKLDFEFSDENLTHIEKWTRAFKVRFEKSMDAIVFELLIIENPREIFLIFWDY